MSPQPAHSHRSVEDTATTTATVCELKSLFGRRERDYVLWGVSLSVYIVVARNLQPGSCGFERLW